MEDDRPLRGPSGFKGVTRKGVSRDDLVKTSYLEGREQRFPLVIEPGVKDLNSEVWVRNSAPKIERELTKHGAILFRGFNVDSVGKFEEFVKAISPDLLEYRERSSPRSEVGAGVYTSTDHPADQSIQFHNEQSYARSWPMKLWFYCVTPAASGGATPIADCRTVFQRIDPKITETFRKKKVLYVRNYGLGFGLSWETAFQTADRSAVEAYCQKNRIGLEWKSKSRLRTWQTFETVVNHPKTGEMLWFEHACFFHISSMEPALQDALLSEFQEADLPFNTYYGDGSTIEGSVLDEIRAIYKEAAVRFSWQKTDILLIDNMLTSHGREPFSGNRKIVVAMTDSFTPKLASPSRWAASVSNRVDEGASRCKDGEIRWPKRKS